MNGATVSVDYYELAWSESGGSVSCQEEKRVTEIISLVPAYCSSILEVGCGDGRITNRLTGGKVIGLDSSREALRHVKAEKILGSVEFLPFTDESFDLVLCCEVLEHLPFEIYPKAIKEIERVAATYIIVTVPNNEDLKSSSVICPQCGCIFNVSRHLRSFNPESLKRIFSQFSLQLLQPCLPARGYPPWLIKGAKLFKIIPDTPFPPNGLCPQCGYSLLSATCSAYAAPEGSRLVRLLRPMARMVVPTKKAGGWLMALFQRR